jgi:hypothetical protein
MKIQKESFEDPKQKLENNNANRKENANYKKRKVKTISQKTDDTLYLHVFNQSTK